MTMTVPSVPTLPAGYVVQAADLNNLASVCTFLMTKPYAHISDQTGGSTIQNLALGANGQVFGGITAPMINNGTSGCKDTDGMFNVAGGSVSLNINTPGYYMCRYGLRAASGSTAIVLTAYLWFSFGANNPLSTFFANGISLYTASGVKDASNNPCVIQGGGLSPCPLYAGDSIAVFAYCDAGSAATVVGAAGTADNTYIEAEWVSTA